jgi:thiol-disulfide isomerase/thioredoxin
LKIGDSISQYKISKFINNDCYSAIIVEFWSVSCPFCKDNVPEISSLCDKISGFPVHRISVHRPMGESDLDEAKVLEVARELGITEKLIFDNDHSLGDELGVNSWPTYFLFDSNGSLRRYAPGQLGVRMIEQALIRLSGENGVQSNEKNSEAVTDSFPILF